MTVDVAFHGMPQAKAITPMPVVVGCLGWLWGLALGAAIAEYPVPGVAMSTGTVAIPFVGWFALMALISVRRPFALPKELYVFYAAYGIFLLYCFFSGMLQGQPMFQKYFKPMVTPAFIPIVTYLLCRQLDLRQAMYHGLLAVLAVGAFYTVYDGVLGGAVRASGATAGANTTAAILALGINFTAWRIFSSERPWERLVLSLLIPVMLAGIFVTASRTGLVTLALVFCGMMFVSRRARRISITLMLVYVTVGGLLIVVFGKSLTLDRARAAFQVALSESPTVQGSATVVKRFNSLLYSMDVFLKNPAFGIGVGGLRTELVQYVGEEKDPHSAYAWLLAETGLVGAALFVVYMTTFLWVVFSVDRVSSSRPSEPRAHGPPVRRTPWLLIGFVTILVLGFAWNIVQEKVFWIWVSVVAAELAANARVRG